MRGFWDERNWRLDGRHIVMPNGWRIALYDIRQWRADMVEGHADLPGRWAGWRIRQNFLLPPGATIRTVRITPQRIQASLQWTAADTDRRQLALF